MTIQNPEVFQGKDFQTLLKDIYDNSKAKKKQIKVLMDSLAKLINNAPDAALVAPLVKDFLEVAVKNDEHLVKIATIMQRLMTAETQTSGVSDFLTEEEKRRLLGEVEEEVEEEVVAELKKVFKETEEVEELEEVAHDLINAIISDTKQAIESRANSNEEEDGTQDIQE